VVLGDVLDDEGAAGRRGIGGRSTYVHLDVSKEAAGRTPSPPPSRSAASPCWSTNAGIIRPAAIEDHVARRLPVGDPREPVGCFLGMRMSVGPIRDHGGGAIVNISSIDGMRAATD